MNQSEKDAATIRLLRIDARSASAADSLEISYLRKQYENERGSAVERTIRYYGPAVLFVLGVWIGASAAN